MCAPGPVPAATEEQTPVVKLPDMPVIADPLKNLPFFPKNEVVPAGLAPGPGSIDAQFPGHAYYEGVSKGTATVGVMLDSQGRPTDYLLIRYTRDYFGASLMRAAHRQTFVPRRVQGLAVPGPFNFTYEFRPVSKIVTMSSFDAIDQRREEIEGGPKFVYAPHVERELDGGQLESTRVVVPVLPADYAVPDGKAPKVLMIFYVDEKGHVRLPHVESAPSVRLIALAIEAVQHWEFKPPTVKGQSALVYTVRVVAFRIPG